MSTTSIPQHIRRKMELVRWMMSVDMPQVLAIELASFTGDDQWPEDVFSAHLHQKNGIGCVGCSPDETVTLRYWTFADDDEDADSVQGEPPKPQLVEKEFPKIVSFGVYELRGGCLALMNMAVHPDYRGQGFGRALLERLRVKLHSQGRRELQIFLPEALRGASSFFGGYDDVAIYPTKHKIAHGLKPVLTAMSTQDASEVQVLDGSVCRHGIRVSRNIRQMLDTGSNYGIVARDASTKLLLGFALYERSNGGIDVDGDFGIVVDPLYKGRGIEDALMTMLKSQALPITVQRVQLSVERIVG